MPFYTFADLSIYSVLPFSELRTSEGGSANQKSAIRFSLEYAPLELALIEWIHHWRAEDGEIVISLAKYGGGFLVRFPDQADFFVSENGNEIRAWKTPETNLGSLRHLFLDQLMPRLIAHRGRLVLHASAVNIGERAIAFMGETGRGKSTLAASLNLAGFPCYTDDGIVVASEDKYATALPLYAGLRLWPHSVTALFSDSSPPALMSSYSEKQRLILSDSNVLTPRPLAAVFLLNDPIDDSQAIFIKRLSPRDACLEMVRNSFQLNVEDHLLAVQVLATASAIAEQVPIFTLVYPRDFSTLPAVHAAILQQLGSADTILQ